MIALDVEMKRNTLHWIRQECFCCQSDSQRVLLQKYRTIYKLGFEIFSVRLIKNTQIYRKQETFLTGLGYTLC